ncbi:alcohol acetyltransferase-domain-containing protein [Xylariaceae sp. FL0594]|nr:alcohol acetyltransferase-domain-containing protein [Xylariaceae sp. FL0594]
MGIKMKDGGGSEAKIVRPLGDMERYQHDAIALRFLANVAVSARYTIPLSLTLPASPEQRKDCRDAVVRELEEALAEVVLEHPTLRIKVVNGHTKKPAWAVVESVHLRRHVQWRFLEDDSGADGGYYGFLRDLLEKRIDEGLQPLLEGRPKWRVLFLCSLNSTNSRSGETGEGVQSSMPFVEAIFEFDHSFVDGMSGKIFHETLLRKLKQRKDAPAGRLLSEDGVLAIPPTASTLAPPLDRVEKITITPSFFLASAWKELRPPSIVSLSNSKTKTKSSRAHWAPIRPDPKDYKTRFRAFDIPPQTLAKLLAECRRHKTTLTGLLQAVLLCGMAKNIPTEKAGAFAHDTALDLRRHVTSLPMPERQMINYVSLMSHKFDGELVGKIRGYVSKKPPATDGEKGQPDEGLVALLWHTASRVRAEIQARLDLGFRNEIAGLMHLVPDWRAQHLLDAQKPRKYSCVVTNLGVFDPDPDPDQKEDVAEQNNSSWSVQHAAFSLSTEVCGAAFQVSTISVRGGALCVGCSWQDCVLDHELAETMVEELESWLRFLGR